jgi:hypothetical protein
MPERRVLRRKPTLRLERRGKQGQEKALQRDHHALTLAHTAEDYGWREPTVISRILTESACQRRLN